MRRSWLGFLSIILGGVVSVCPIKAVFAAEAPTIMLSSIANPSAIAPAATINNNGVASTPINPQVSQQTQSIFHDTAQNLNLYVTQLQCQSAGMSNNNCNTQTNTTNNSPTLMNSVNKFLFDSVTSSLGVGVEVNF